MSEVILKTTNLTKQYDKIRVVDQVSLTIEKGDIYGFIGENGAGKTTFMRMVSGLTFPTSGSLELFGISSLKELSEARRRMGTIIEHPALFNNMTAMENLVVQRRYLNLRTGANEKEEMQQLLELVGLSNVGKQKAGKFSLGMRQRLGLAIALTGNPEFLMLDEPTIGLDPVGVMELRELLLKLNKKQKVTILVSSHNLSELTQIASKYGFLHKGKLLEQSEAKEVSASCEKKGIQLETYFLELLKNVAKSERGIPE